MKKIFNVFAAYLLVILPLTVFAQIPRTLSYQGVLTDNAGKPRPDGNNYAFTFRLYDTPSGGIVIWSEQKTLPVKNGLFSTALGDQTSFGVAVKFDRQYWLGIQVGNEPEFAPRIALTSVGYSMNSLRADTARVAMAAPADGVWARSDTNVYRVDGNIGIGTAMPTAKLHVVGNARQGESILRIGSDDPGNTYLSISTTAFSSGHARLQAVRNEGNAWGDIALNPSGGDVQIGGELVWGNNSVLNTDQGGSIELGGNVVAGTRTPYIDFHSPGGDPDYNVRIINDASGQLSFKAQRVVASGRMITSVLEITGGSDLAEPFPTSEAESLSPGAVVVIDENNPGHLKLSRKPYDKGVAGIVSGAGGINPGLTLRQEGVMEGEQNIALTGRVYALATAVNGSIKPGDRLTTSALPGHCMKATDSSLCDGAVIGKAMSSLQTGEGLVLVLVNLQ